MGEKFKGALIVICGLIMMVGGVLAVIFHRYEYFYLSEVWIIQILVMIGVVVAVIGTIMFITAKGPSGGGDSGD